MLALAVVLFIHLLLAPIVFGRGFVEAFEYPKSILLLLTAIVLLSADLFSTGGGEPGLLPRGVSSRDLLAAGILLFLASATASVLASISPRVSLLGAHESYAGLLTVASYTTLFFGTRALFRAADDVRGLLFAPVMAAGVVSVYAAVQSAGMDAYPWREVATVGAYVRPFSTLGHPNSMAAYLVMTLPLTLHFALASVGSRRWPAAGVLFAVAIVSGFGVLASLSRAAWLGAASSLAVFVLLSQKARSKRQDRRVLYAAGAVLSGLFILAMHGLRETVAARLANLTTGGGRAFMWEASLDLFRQRPLLGWGLDAFQLAFVRERRPEYWLVEWSATPGRAHNEALHVLATQGVLGAAACLIVLGGVALAARRAWLSVASEERPLIAAIVSSLVGFVVPLIFGFTVLATGTLFVTLAAALSARDADPHSGPAPPWLSKAIGAGVVLTGAVFFLNHWLDAPGPAAMMWAVVFASVAAVTGITLPGFQDVRTRRLIAPAAAGHPSRRRGIRDLPVAAVMLTIAYFVVVRPAQASWACKTGDGHLRRGRSGEAARAFGRAVALDSVRDLYWTRLGTALEAEAGTLTDPTRQRAPLEAALEAFEQGERRVPANPYNRNNVARALGRLAAIGAAQVSEANAAFDAAVALDPSNAYFLVDAADAATASGDLARARAYAERTVSLYPAFAAPYLQLARLASREGRPDEALALFRRSAQMDWHGDRSGEAQSAVELALALIRMGLFQEAHAAARTALARSPDHPLARLALARAAVALGDIAGARREYQELLRLQPDFAFARQELESLQSAEP